MNMTAKMVAAYFDSKDLKYTLTGDDGEVIEIGMTAKNTSLRAKFIFGEDGKHVALRAYNVVKIPDNKIPDILLYCNHLNGEYRWVKFYVDTDDNTVTVEDDAILDIDTAGAECFELFLRLVNIVDECYPSFMKLMYA